MRRQFLRKFFGPFDLKISSKQWFVFVENMSVIDLFLMTFAGAFQKAVCFPILLKRSAKLATYKIYPLVSDWIRRSCKVNNNLNQSRVINEEVLQCLAWLVIEVGVRRYLKRTFTFQSTNRRYETTPLSRGLFSLRLKMANMKASQTAFFLLSFSLLSISSGKNVKHARTRANSTYLPYHCFRGTDLTNNEVKLHWYQPQAMTSRSPW